MVAAKPAGTTAGSAGTLQRYGASCNPKPRSGSPLGPGVVWHPRGSSWGWRPLKPARFAHAAFATACFPGTFVSGSCRTEVSLPVLPAIRRSTWQDPCSPAHPALQRTSAHVLSPSRLAQLQVLEFHVMLQLRCCISGLSTLLVHQCQKLCDVHS